MNWEKIGTEAAQFPEEEYINGIFVAVPPAVHFCTDNSEFPSHIFDLQTHTENEGPERVQCKCLVPIFVVLAMKQCDLVISKTVL
jgi:hypothetical protein